MNRSIALVHSTLNKGRIDYLQGWALQHLLLEQRLARRRVMKTQMNETHPTLTTHETDRDRILLFEHDCVYTLGRGADENNLRFLQDEKDGGARSKQMLSRSARGVNSCRLSTDKLKGLNAEKSTVKDIYEMVKGFDHQVKVLSPNGVPIYRVERGGEVTYHGPGQLICYPMLDLQNYPYKQDLHWYLRNLEEVIIEALCEYGIHGKRDVINTGVWVGTNKIAAIGISSARWITTHGFALNVNPNLDRFDTSLIIPCGVEGKGVTSICNELHGNCSPSIEEVADVLLEKMKKVFGISVDLGQTI